MSIFDDDGKTWINYGGVFQEDRYMNTKGQYGL